MNMFDENSPFIASPETKSTSALTQNEFESYTPFLDSTGEVVYENVEGESPNIFFNSEEEFEKEKKEHTLISELEIQEELSGDLLQKTVELNERYKKLYKWEGFIPQILAVINIDPVQLPWAISNPIKFAQVVAAWQDKNGIKTDFKGVFGLNLWTYIQKKIGLHNLSNQYNIDTNKAVRNNKHYENRIWSRDEIYKYLADNKIIQLPLPLNDEYFSWAVADFQKAKQLSVDGILGNITIGAMKKGSSAPPVPVPPKPSGKSRWHEYIKGTTLCAAEPMVYGKDTYKAMVEAIRSTNKRGHYIYILGWMFDANFPLIPNQQNTTMKALLSEAARKGVEIRVMIWNNPYYLQEIKETEAALNGTGNSLVLKDNVTYGSPYVSAGLAVLRNRIAAIPSPIRSILDKMDIDKWEEIKKYSVASNEGSHHEKVLIVKNDEGLIGFCGGIDINPDRIGSFSTSGFPLPITGFDEKGLPIPFPTINFEPLLEILHDVHCKVKGYGAYSLLQRFLWRWNHFKTVRGNIYPLMNNKLAGEDERPPSSSLAGNGISNVKILHTYNAKNGNDFGRSIFNTVKTAILNAEKSVHFECQYMISVEIAKLLHDKILEMQSREKKFYVSILTQEDKFAASDIPMIKRMRKTFLDTLYGSLSRTDERIKVWMLDISAPFPAHHKVHSKLYVVDRELVIIGSANCSRRSMTHDSETAAVIFNDPGYTNDFVNSLEKKYDRISFWKPYLPDTNVKDIDEKLIETVDEHLNSLSLTSVITTLLTGIGGKIILTSAIKSLASALPELLRPIVDPYDERTKIEQEFSYYDNEQIFRTNNILDSTNGESFVNESLSPSYNDISDEADQHKEHLISDYSDYENNLVIDNYDQLEPPLSSLNNSAEENFLNNYSSITFPGFNETNPEYVNIISEEIKRENSPKNKPCEGRTCWAKSVLNRLTGLNLAINNTLDEPTKNALADFQSKIGLPRTKQIDAVTERALLEADAVHRTKGTDEFAVATASITSAKTKIEDWTSKGVSGVRSKPQHILNSFRDPRKVWAFVLHHMAFKRKGAKSKKLSDPESYLNTGSHFCIMLDGRIIQLHPVSRMIWHGNCLSPRSVAVEFEGNFPNIKGQWWINKESTIQNKDVPTQAQYDSGKFLASYLKIVLGTTHIFAHRQSSDSRENDPGPDIWYNVGQWAIDNLKMTDGGSAFKCGTGNPILPEWRTWGNQKTKIPKEFEASYELSDSEEMENTHSHWTKNEEENYPEDEINFSEMDQLVKDWSTAIRLNNYYGNLLGWNKYYDKLNEILLQYFGLQNVSMGEEAFAKAVAAWQQQQGLTSDGIIGPNTWGRMKTLVYTISSNQPPQSPLPSPAGDLRSNIVNVALQEWNKWEKGVKKETDGSMQSILQDYWISGTGSDYGYKNKLAWSAAFISWVVKKAGGGSNFRYSGAHTTYTYYAKQNRLQNNSNPFKAYRITEKKPELGDIIVQNRGSSTITYDNLQPDTSGTHGDIVVKVNQNTIEVAGGNLSDSVRINTYSLDTNGYLNSPAQFAIIKIESNSSGKPQLNSPDQSPIVTPQPVTITPPSVQNIFEFNRWHAQSILDSMNASIVGTNFNSKLQLEKIIRGEQVFNVNPNNQLIQVLPIIHHIAESAKAENYSQIIIGSFIREPDSNGKCTGHCVGRCIDINFKGGGFDSPDSTQMVIKILRYLVGLSSQYKKSLGFGLPLQGDFFGKQNLPKFKSTDPSNLLNSELRQLIPQLGIVFPDNNNHLHIQVGWQQSTNNITIKEFEYRPSDFDSTQNEETDEQKESPEFDNYSLSYRLEKVKDWKSLLLFKVPDELVTKLKSRNMYVQYPHNESYSNDLNVDFYRLKINKYPTVDNRLLNEVSLIKYIRQNINNLVDTSYCDFYPYSKEIDAPIWNSDNPFGSVLDLDIKGPDNAAVVVSLTKPNGWRFTTVNTPKTGAHPVSGHREFFIAKDSQTGADYFVIKGLDMLSTGIAGLGLPIFGNWGFSQADSLWKSMQSKIVDFINSNGGEAKKDIIYSERVEWRYVYYSYKHLLEMTFGKGAGSAENSSFFD